VVTEAPSDVSNRGSVSSETSNAFGEMLIESTQSSIARIQREIETLHRQQTAEDEKEAAKLARIAQITKSITRSTPVSSLQSKQRSIRAIESEIVAGKKRRADIMKRIAAKTSQLHKEQQNLYTQQGREQKSLTDSLKRRDAELKKNQNSALRELASRPLRTTTVENSMIAPDEESYDAFISHATEDKDVVVRPLAEKLRALGLAIWYDEFQLRVGDSLRRSIDRGLAKSRFGIVVLSPSFFAKNWPQYELDGLVAKEMTGGKVVLPLWHKVSKDEVIAFSPTLADRVALSTATYSVDELAKELATVLRPDV
jgi:hypothetical protein